MWMKVLRLREAISRAYEVNNKMNERYKKYFDRKSSEPDLRIGDQCYIHRPAIEKGKSRALSSQFRGPFQIMDLTETGAMIVPCISHQAKPKWVNIWRLKLVSENYTPTYKECELAAKEQYSLSEDEDAEHSDEMHIPPQQGNVDSDQMSSEVELSCNQELPDGMQLGNSLPASEVDRRKEQQSELDEKTRTLETLET